MAMEISGNYYSSYAASGMTKNSGADSTKKKETESTRESAGGSKAKSTSEYVNELAKLAPSVEFMVGNGLFSAKSGKTLTINPMLLKKMQNDPAQEKETKELIKGVESAMKMIESLNRASGWTVVYKHSYIDENGKYHSIGYYRNDFMLNLSDELREERRKNSEKLIDKTKENGAEKKEKIEEMLEEKRAAAKDGRMYLDEEDMRTMIEAIKEEPGDKPGKNKQTQAGANLDLQV